ncbi:MAG TPA: hypothetical protein VHR41_06000 [Gemmatimonadales bacterium]|jgi:hypothetical protein|nr:hypothetical protein [Gemmatimonadales bacterium]
MRDYKLACGARLTSSTHDHSCYHTKDHSGKHVCSCGIKWDDARKISVGKKPPRRR